MTPNLTETLLYRQRLVRLTRRAWAAWGEASEVHQETVTALAPCEVCIAQAVRRCRHAQARYDRLETALAVATELPRASVYNAIARGKSL
jgi:hypothetical protein